MAVCNLPNSYLADQGAGSRAFVGHSISLGWCWPVCEVIAWTVFLHSNGLHRTPFCKWGNHFLPGLGRWEEWCYPWKVLLSLLGGPPASSGPEGGMKAAPVQLRLWLGLGNALFLPCLGGGQLCRFDRRGSETVKDQPRCFAVAPGTPVSFPLAHLALRSVHSSCRSPGLEHVRGGRRI